MIFLRVAFKVRGTVTLMRNSVSLAFNVCRISDSTNSPPAHITGDCLRQLNFRDPGLECRFGNHQTPPAIYSITCRTLRYVCDLFFLGFFATMETIITDWLQVEGGSNPKRKRAELVSLERLPLN